MITSQQFYELLWEVYNQGEMPLGIRAYSGRFMYGERCIGVDLSGFDEVWRLAVLVDRFAHAQGFDPVGLPNPRTDNMGRGAIAYWPQFAWADNMKHLDSEEGL